MLGNKGAALSGVNNKRLNNMDVRNNKCTEPLTDTAYRSKASGITIPPEEDVIHAKEWVDDGSVL